MFKNLHTKSQFYKKIIMTSWTYVFCPLSKITNIFFCLFAYLSKTCLRIDESLHRNNIYFKLTHTIFIMVNMYIVELLFMFSINFFISNLQSLNSFLYYTIVFLIITRSFYRNWPAKSSFCFNFKRILKLKLSL